MRSTSGGMLEVEGSSIYYQMAGSGEALVLCHAGFVGSRMWDDQWEEFARHFRVVRFDLCGYGKSPLPDRPTARRRELEALVDQLGIRRALLLGCSLGGTIALDFALEHPDRVDGLILVSAVPSGFEMRGEPPRDLVDMFSAGKQGDLKRVSELQVRLWVDGPFRRPEQVDPQVRRRAAEMNRIPVEHGTWGKVDMKPIDPLDPPAVRRLDEIHAPALIIAGALDDPELLRAADVMSAGIPGAQKVILPDAAHLPNMERSAEFSRAVFSFVQRGDFHDHQG